MSEPATPRTAERSFPGTPGSVAEMRSWSRAWLDKFGLPSEAAENAVLVLSELCTNAVVHSRSSGPHATYRVCLRRGVSRLRVEVTDAGGPTEPIARRHRPPSREQSPTRHHSNGHPSGLPGTAPAAACLAESGRGLALVEAFTTRWWTRGDPHSRTVCAELPLT